MSELQIQIQGQLDNALPSDVIQLPNETIDFPLIISKPCTVMGMENTVIDITELEETIAIQIITDSVTLSDISIKNKIQTGYYGITAIGEQISIERIKVNSDIGILINKSNDIDIIEVSSFNSSTGIKIMDSMNVELNACDVYNCSSIGLDIIGTSSVKGSIDSYQGFGLNVSPLDLTGLNEGEYEFKLDGMIFTLELASGMSYQDIVTQINLIDGFNPIYTAEFLENDIVIKTENDNVLIEASEDIKGLVTELGSTLKTPSNNNISSYASFGLDISPDDISPLDKNVLFTFNLDGSEIQFYSSETDGTTYQELADIIGTKIDDMYTVVIEDNDIRIYANEISVVLADGERFKHLFEELGIDTLPQHIEVVESSQGFGLNVVGDDTTNLEIGQYLLLLNGSEYLFNLASVVTYNQLVSTINSNPSFSINYVAEFVDGDIVISNSMASILISKKNAGLLKILGTTLNEAITGSEETRKDRSHNINVIGCLIHANTIGVRIMNGNDVTFISNTKVYENTNIGIWQMPSSYNNSFRGEIYLNKNYGIRNTDKTGSVHNFDAMDSWWGDMTGPSMFGTGEGDKISAQVTYTPIRQTGTIPDQSYPKTREFILSALGYPVVKVELTDEQIEMCIDKAIAKYMQYRTPEPVQRYIPLGAGNGTYFLPLDIPKEDIIEVTYSPNADIFAQLSGSGESFMMTYYMNGSGSSFLSDFYIAMAYKETMEQVLGIAPAYELMSALNEDGEYQDVIRLSPKPDGNVSLGLLVSRPLTEGEVDSTEWIHKYALSWAKEFLGRVRSKYGSVPGPTGEMSLDGPTLLGEAQTERLALEESVILVGTPLGFYVG